MPDNSAFRPSAFDLASEMIYIPSCVICNQPGKLTAVLVYCQQQPFFMCYRHRLDLQVSNGLVKEKERAKDQIK